MVPSETLRAKFLDWWHQRNDRPVMMINAWDGSPPYPEPESDEDYWFDFPDRLEREKYYMEHTLCFGDAFPSLYINFGPGMLGACMGGNYAYDRLTFWYTEPVLDDLSDIHKFCLDPENYWWKQAVEFTDYAIEHSEGKYLASVNSTACFHQ